MKTLATLQRGNDQRTFVHYFSIAQRVLFSAFTAQEVSLEIRMKPVF